MESKGPRFFFVPQFAHFGDSQITILQCLKRRMTGKIHKLPGTQMGAISAVFGWKLCPDVLGGGVQVYACDIWVFP